MQKLFDFIHATESFLLHLEKFWLNSLGGDTAACASQAPESTTLSALQVIKLHVAFTHCQTILEASNIVVMLKHASQLISQLRLLEKSFKKEESHLISPCSQSAQTSIPLLLSQPSIGLTEQLNDLLKNSCVPELSPTLFTPYHQKRRALYPSKVYTAPSKTLNNENQAQRLHCIQ